LLKCISPARTCATPVIPTTARSSCSGGGRAGCQPALRCAAETPRGVRDAKATPRPAHVGAGQGESSSPRACPALGNHGAATGREDSPQPPLLQPQRPLLPLPPPRARGLLEGHVHPLRGGIVHPLPLQELGDGQELEARLELPSCNALLGSSVFRNSPA